MDMGGDGGGDVEGTEGDVAAGVPMHHVASTPGGAVQKGAMAGSAGGVRSGDVLVFARRRDGRPVGETASEDERGVATEMAGPSSSARPTGSMVWRRRLRPRGGGTDALLTPTSTRSMDEMDMIMEGVAADVRALEDGATLRGAPLGVGASLMRAAGRRRLGLRLGLRLRLSEARGLVYGGSWRSGYLCGPDENWSTAGLGGQVIFTVRLSEVIFKNLLSDIYPSIFFVHWYLQ
eukprot:SAG11_NODE_1384_length_5070_cov_110.918527_1_plen_234_part_00